MKAFTEYRKHQRAVSLVQRSPEWHNARKYCISGSEMHKWIQTRGNRNSAFFRDKIHGSTFTGNSATFHGTMNEGISLRYTEKYFGCTIHEVGSIAGCVPYHRYSPDGLGLVRKNPITDPHHTHSQPPVTQHTATHNYARDLHPSTHPHIDINTTGAPDSVDPLNDDTYDLVLFEFKNPYTMKKLPADIPAHYVAQPLAGLCDIPLANYAMFVNCKVVMPQYAPQWCPVCNTTDYCMSASPSIPNSSDGSTHDKTAEYVDGCVSETIAVGYIGLYTVDLTKLSLPDGWADTPTPCSRTLWDNPAVHKKYKVAIGARGITEQTFIRWCAANFVHPVKFMPVKILDAKLIRIDREPAFIANLAARLKADMEYIISVRPE